MPIYSKPSASSGTAAAVSYVQGLGIINVNNYNTVLQAIADLPSSGGILYFPPGTHLVPTNVYTDLPSGTKVCGAGPASIVKRNTAGTAPIFRCLGVSDISFNDLKFDINYDAYPENYTTAIQFGDLNGTGSSNCTVDNCVFDLNGTPVFANTHHAVLANNCSNLRISNCRITKMQLKCASAGTPAGPVTVIGCHIDNPYNFATSFVGNGVSDDLRNFTFAFNECVNVPSNGAVFVGGDGETTAVGKLYNTRIVGNNFVGGWGTGSNQTLGIHVRLATDTQDLYIQDNVVVNTGSTYSAVSRGISVIEHTTPANVILQRCIISNNIVKNQDLEGIYLQAEQIKGLQIMNNQCYATRGIVVIGDSGSEDWIISNNYSRDKHYGVMVRAASGSNIDGIQILNNVCKNNILAGISVEARADATIKANVRGNHCYDSRTPKTMPYGISGSGPGTVTVTHTDNNVTDVLITGTIGI